MTKPPVTFRYSVNAYENGIIEPGVFVCGCCGRKALYAYRGSMYCPYSTVAVCVDCLANGEAARKFDATFVLGGNTRAVRDPEKIDELFHRTPGYPSRRGAYFPACCGDFCTFIGETCTEELVETGIADEVFEDHVRRGSDPHVRKTLTAAGSTAGYLFRCIHCGKYHLHVETE